MEDNASNIPCGAIGPVDWGKTAPMLIGGALVAIGLTKRSKAGIALAVAGGGLAYAGAMQRARSDSESDGSSVERTITIGKPEDEVYQFWTQPENLEKILPGVQSIAAIGGNRWHWEFNGPADHTIQLDTELIDSDWGKSIHWKSVGESMIDHEGRAEFRTAPAGRGTEVRLTLDWHPSGPVTRILKGLIGKPASWHVSEALRRGKQLLETGELSTAEWHN